MSAQILDGRVLAGRIRENVKTRLQARNAHPGLGVILVGENPASHTYVELKRKACEEVGIRFEKILYPADVSDTELLEKIDELNSRLDVHGILVQLPLPEGHDTDAVIVRIQPNKDVDGFHPENVRRLHAGQPCLAPAVALGIMKLIDKTHEPLVGKTAAILSSNLFADPIRLLLKERGIEAIHDPSKADILIVALGKPGSITADKIKQGAIVIDVGTTKVEGKLVGDIDHASVEPVADWLTPVPGGVGPMTVAMLLVNVLKAFNQASPTGEPTSQTQKEGPSPS